MKQILLVLTILFATSLQSQDCFVQQSDFSGSISLSGLNELETAACDLISKFPVAYQDSFAVYDIGLYSIAEQMEGGLAQSFLDRLAQLPTDYYLTFGRKSNHSADILVKINLPTSGEFSCLDLISTGYRENIENTVNIATNTVSGAPSISLRKGINKLGQIIDKVVDCCEPGVLSGGCNSCLVEAPPSGMAISAREIHKKMDAKGIVLEPVLIASDEEYELPAIVKGQSGSSSRSTVSDINATVDFYDNIGQDLDSLAADITIHHLNNLSTYHGLASDFSIHVFKFPRDCGLFEEKWDLYNNDDTDFALFISLINIDGIVGEVGIHFKSNTDLNTLRKKTNSNSRTPLEDSIAMDARLYLLELAEKENVCENLALGYLYKFDSGINDIISNIHNESDRKFYQDYYDRKRSAADVKLKEAQTQWTYYYNNEYDFQVRHGANRILAWASTRLTLCKTLIHNVLDACGLGAPPVGPFCDGLSVVSYVIEGDKANAKNSAYAIIPIIGDIRSGARMGRIVVKNSNEIVGELSWVYNIGKKAPEYIGKSRGIMKSWMITRVGQNVNKFGDEVLDAASNLNVPHHLSPWALFNPEAVSFNSTITKKLAKVGWHPSNPKMNGLVIPKKLPDGRTFHSSHKFYNKYCEDMLELIVEEADGEILDLMKKFNKHLSAELYQAYTQKKSIVQHFVKGKKGLTIEELRNIVL